jgi:hypothetical protein
VLAGLAVAMVLVVQDGLLVVNVVHLRLAGDDVGAVARATAEAKDEAGDDGHQAAETNDGGHDDADYGTHAEHQRVHVLERWTRHQYKIMKMKMRM